MTFATLSKNGNWTLRNLWQVGPWKISRTEENSFCLRQIRKEETQLYFKRANQAMKDKNFSLSQLLARYQENVQEDLEYRRQKREVLLQKSKEIRMFLWSENLWKSWTRRKRILRKFGPRCLKMMPSRTSSSWKPRRQDASAAVAKAKKRWERQYIGCIWNQLEDIGNLAGSEH